MSTADTTVFVTAGVVSSGLLVVAIVISISTLICIKKCHTELGVVPSRIKVWVSGQSHDV